MLVTIKQNLFVRRVKPSDQLVPWILASTIRINFLDGFDGNAAGFLAALVTAHAVGHNRQSAGLLKLLPAKRFPIGITVFVVGAQTPTSLRLASSMPGRIRMKPRVILEPSDKSTQAQARVTLPCLPEDAKQEKNAPNQAAISKLSAKGHHRSTHWLWHRKPARSPICTTSVREYL